MRPAAMMIAAACTDGEGADAPWRGCDAEWRLDARAKTRDIVRS